MAAQYVQSGVANVSQLHEALQEMLAPLYLSGGEIFGVEPGERWSFSIYLYSAAKDELIPIWREKSRNHPSSDNGRSWGRGQGHVGKAFVDRKVVLTGDATHPDVIQLCNPPAGLQRAYDGTAYRSFASIPIGPLGEGGHPYGVLVGTSDHKNRFTEDRSLLLMHFAGAVATLFGLGRLDFDCLTGDGTSYSNESEDKNEKTEHSSPGE